MVRTLFKKLITWIGIFIDRFYCNFMKMSVWLQDKEMFTKIFNEITSVETDLLTILNDKNVSDIIKCNQMQKIHDTHIPKIIKKIPQNNFADDIESLVVLLKNNFQKAKLLLCEPDHIDNIPRCKSRSDYKFNFDPNYTTKVNGVVFKANSLCQF